MLCFSEVPEPFLIALSPEINPGTPEDCSLPGENRNGTDEPDACLEPTRLDCDRAGVG